MCAWDAAKPAGTDRIRDSDDSIRANWTEVELRRLENLIKNSSFTSRSAGTSAVPDGWALEGTPTVAYDTVDVGYGDYAVKLTASGATDEGIKYTLTNLKVSTKYQVFVRMKVTGGDTASLITTGATTNINEDSTSTSWESVTGEFVTDGSATNVVLKLVASADGDVAYFCGITVVEGDVPPANFIRPVTEFIDWQDWVPTLTGGSADLGGYTDARYYRIDKICFFYFNAVNKDLSGSAGSIQVTLPFTAANTEDVHISNVVYDGSSWVAENWIVVTKNTNYLAIAKGIDGGNWAASETGLKIYMQGFFEIA